MSVWMRCANSTAFFNTVLKAIRLTDIALTKRHTVIILKTFDYFKKPNPCFSVKIWKCEI